MKTTLLTFMGLFALGLNAQVTLIDEDFEGMNMQETVSGQSDDWEQFSCNDYEEGAPYISSDESESGEYSLNLDWDAVGEDEDPPSIFMVTDEIDSGILDISFLMFAEEGSYPLITLSHDWACNDEDIEIGSMLIFANGSVIALMDIDTEEDITYPTGEWFEVEVSIDFDADEATMKVAESPEFSWVWSLYYDDVTEQMEEGLNQFQSLAFVADQNFGMAGSIYIDDVIVELDSSVGIETASDTAISFYPNPANDRVTFTGDFQNAAVRILDLSGKVVLQETINGATVNLGLGGLNQGLYLLELVNGNERTTQKLVINH